MDLYARIKTRRIELGISQEALAKKLGYSDRSTIAKIESGINDITQTKIIAFAEALETTPVYLMGWAAEFSVQESPFTEYPYTPKEQSNMKKYRAVDDHGRRTIDTVTDYEYERCYPDSPLELRVMEFPVAIEPAAAGFGNYLTDSGFEQVSLNAAKVPLKAKFGIRVSGNSMEPEYKDGDIVFVEPMPAILNGDLGIFNLDGEAIFKKLVVDAENKTIILRSLNKEYNDRIVPRGSNLHTYGRVLGKAEK